MKYELAHILSLLLNLTLGKERGGNVGQRERKVQLNVKCWPSQKTPPTLCKWTWNDTNGKFGKLGKW